ncbi:hypothetical protein NADE_003320 [Nannochloris sp. 'desiccata']|nr:hypothetical protein KSW81_000644 [Chlorella desiccata (nom. nud.)]KAH7615627.1 hypothetical protein NADE_007424 [Chlorella desiccata (nom. nud.)]KAH7615783.1 hypothetical protein NADE_007573 [Chlorella desiccata (nom. nud.)]KAH7620707.1 hypothetical protein NADE_003320 [Chlorella desiccata (nom. nud.)]
MDGPPAFQAPENGQPQRQRKSPRNNQQQWRRKSQHKSNNNKHRIPPQQQKNFKRRSSGKRGGQTELGFFGSVPSLQDLQRENRKRTRRHYGNNTNQQRGAFSGSSPASIITKPPPPPPYFPHYLSNDNIDNIYRDNNKPKLPWLSPTGRFLAPPAAPTPARFPGAELANPLATPTLAANQNGAADKLEAEGLHAGLDFFATNDGLVLYNDTPAPSSWTEDEDENDGEMDSHSLSGSEDDDHDGTGNEDAAHEHGRRARLLRRPAGSTFAGNGFGGSGVHARIIQRLRDRVAQQDAYIAELEDDNLRYKERLDLLVHQLREIQEGSGGSPVDGMMNNLTKNAETNNEPEPTAAPAAAAEVTIKKVNENDGAGDGSEMNESPALKA